MSTEFDDSGINSSSSVLNPGEKWDDYEIIGKIGEGGMGIVYKARQTSPDRIVALKIINQQNISMVQRKRFVREVTLAAKLDHPSIVKVLHCNLESTNPYIAMEYIKGRSLQSYLDSGEFEKNQIWNWLIQIAGALDYSHGQQVLHRDVKPANIMISESGQAYLVDFGLAKKTELENDRASRLTRTGSLVGTISYMAPEQAEGKKVGVRSDIYSLGAIIYRFATGKSHLSGEATFEQLFQLIDGVPLKPSNICQISPSLEKIVLCAMAPHPEDRYTSAKAFAKDLTRYIRNEDISNRRIPKWRRRKANRSLAKIAILVFIASLCFWFGLQQLSSVEKPLTFAQRLEKWKYLKKNEKEIQQVLSELKKLCDQNPLEVNQHIPMVGQLPSLRLEKQFFQILETHQLEERILTRLLFLKEKKREIPESIWIAERLQRLGYLHDAHDILKEAYLQSSSFASTPLTPSLLQKFWMSCYYTGRALPSLTMLQKLSIKDQRKLKTFYTFVDGLCLGEHDNWENVTIPEAFKDKSQLWLGEYYFLQARYEWSRIRPYLSSWGWLAEQADDSMKQKIHQGLQKVERYLGEAMTACKRAQLEGALFHRLSARILFYQKVCQAESGREEVMFDEAKRWPWQYRTIASEARSHYLIKNQEWDLVEDECSRTIEEFPWSPYSYVLRSYACMQRGDWEGAEQDVYYFLSLRPQDITPLYNFTELTYGGRINLESFLAHQRITLYYFFQRNTPKQLQESFIQQYLKDFIYEPSVEVTQQVSEGTLLRLWQHISRNEQDVPDVAIRLFVEAYMLSNKEDWETKIFNTKELLHSKIQNEIRKYKEEKRSQQVRNLLKRYAVFSSAHIVNEFYNIPKYGEYLSKILMDDTEAPAAKYLAAKVMVELRTPAIHQRLWEILEESTSPASLFVAYALRDNFFPAELPPDILTRTEFEKVLYAFSLKPKLRKKNDPKPVSNEGKEKIKLLSDEKTVRSLLQDKSNNVFLAISFFVNQWSAHRKTFTKERERIFRICNDGTVQQKRFAFKILWNSDDVDRDKNSAKKNRRDLVREQWNDKAIQNVILKYMKSEHLQISVLEELGNQEYSLVYLNQSDARFSADAKSNPFWSKLQKLVIDIQKNSNDLNLKTWCTLVRFQMEQEHFDEWLAQNNLPGFSRVVIAMTIPLKRNPHLFINLIRKTIRQLPNYVSVESQKRSDQQFMQATLLNFFFLDRHVPKNFHLLYRGTIIPLVNAVSFDQNPPIQSAALLAVTFSPSRKAYSKLMSRFRKTTELTDLAYTVQLLESLSSLHFSLYPKKMDSLYKSIKRKHPKLASKAYLSLYKTLFADIWMIRPQKYDYQGLDYSVRYKKRMKIIRGHILSWRHNKDLKKTLAREIYFHVADAYSNNIRWQLEKNFFLLCNQEKGSVVENIEAVLKKLAPPRSYRERFFQHELKALYYQAVVRMFLEKSLDSESLEDKTSRVWPNINQDCYVRLNKARIFFEFEKRELDQKMKEDKKKTAHREMIHAALMDLDDFLRVKVWIKLATKHNLNIEEINKMEYRLKFQKC